MKKGLLASALLAMGGLLVPLAMWALGPLAMGWLTMMQPPTTYTISGSLWDVSGAISGEDFGPVTGGTVTSSPAGIYDSIDCPPACTSVYDADTWVTLTATPSRGWVFTGWSNGRWNTLGCSGTGPCKIQAPAGWTATFRRKP